MKEQFEMFGAKRSEKISFKTIPHKVQSALEFLHAKALEELAEKGYSVENSSNLFCEMQKGNELWEEVTYSRYAKVISRDGDGVLRRMMLRTSVRCVVTQEEGKRQRTVNIREESHEFRHLTEE